MCSILLFPLVARCLETIYVCIWRMLVFMSVVVTVWGSVGMSVVYRPLLKVLVVLRYIVCLCRGCDGFVFSVCIVKRGAVGARVWEVGIFRHADVLFVYCVHPVTVLNAAFCMACNRHSLRVVELWFQLSRPTRSATVKRQTTPANRDPKAATTTTGLHPTPALPDGRRRTCKSRPCIQVPLSYICPQRH